MLLYLNRPVSTVQIPLAVKTLLRQEMRPWTPGVAPRLHLIGNEDEEEVA